MTNYFGAPGKSMEWYTPKYVFDAMGVKFDLDVAVPSKRPELGQGHSQTFVPCEYVIPPDFDGLKQMWSGFVWMNPPFEGRNGLVPWLDKFFAHGNGVCLVPDRTSAPWWQAAARRAGAVLFIDGKVRFIKPDGTTGNSPGDGTCLMSVGRRGLEALDNARHAGLGWMAHGFAEDLD